MCNLVYSKIDNESCELQSKFEAPLLNELYLRECKINEIGYSNIFQSPLPNLTLLNLNKFIFI